MKMYFALAVRHKCTGFLLALAPPGALCSRNALRLSDIKHVGPCPVTGETNGSRNIVVQDKLREYEKQIQELTAKLSAAEKEKSTFELKCGEMEKVVREQLSSFSMQKVQALLLCCVQSSCACACMHHGSTFQGGHALEFITCWCLGTFHFHQMPKGSQ